MGAGRNIKFLIQDKNIKQKDFAEAIGETTVNVTRWLSEQRGIPEEVYPKIANYLNVSLDTILGNEIKTSSVKLVPVTGTASCGAVEPSIYDGKKKAYYNGDFFKDTLYCVIACGDSMAPEIDDGDEVIIDPDVKPTTGDMVYYKLDEEAAIKVLVEDTDAYMLQFIPYNTSEEFKIRTIRMDDEDTMSRLTIHKVVSVNKLKFNNRLARLKMIGRG